MIISLDSSREIGFTNQIISSARLIFSKTKSKHFKMLYLLWCNSTARHQKAHQALKKAFEDQVLSFGMSHCKVSCNSSTCSFSKYAGIASLIVQKPVCHSLKVWHQSVVIAQVWSKSFMDEVWVTHPSPPSSILHCPAMLPFLSIVFRDFSSLLSPSV